MRAKIGARANVPYVLGNVRCEICGICWRNTPVTTHDSSLDVMNYFGQELMFKHMKSLGDWNMVVQRGSPSRVISGQS